MPPKPKCTREEIAQAALKIIKEKGSAELTARNLGSSLGTSASPIFTFFRNMEEVKMAARELAMEEFFEYISDYREYTPAFKRIGMMIVSYGISEPELFKLLFMQEHEKRQSLEGTLGDLGDFQDTCIELIQKDYGLTEDEARLLLEQMWTCAFGMGVMCAMKVCDFTKEEINCRLGTMFAGLIMLIKSGKINEIYVDVEKRTDHAYKGMDVSNIPYIKE